MPDVNVLPLLVATIAAFVSGATYYTFWAGNCD